MLQWSISEGGWTLTDIHTTRYRKLFAQSMITIEVTPIQKKILDMLNEARPYEIFEIQLDKNGKPDTYLVHRTQKVVLSAFKLQ